MKSARCSNTDLPSAGPVKRELQGFFLDDGPIVRECPVTQLVLANLHHVVEQRRLQNCLYPMRLSGECGIALLQQGGASHFQVLAAL